MSLISESFLRACARPPECQTSYKHL